ncbi:unnamed protein product [Rhodiola kirilowii]
MVCRWGGGLYAVAVAVWLAPSVHLQDLLEPTRSFRRFLRLELAVVRQSGWGGGVAVAQAADRQNGRRGADEECSAWMGMACQMMLIPGGLGSTGWRCSAVGGGWRRRWPSLIAPCLFCFVC